MKNTLYIFVTTMLILNLGSAIASPIFSIGGLNGVMAVLLFFILFAHEISLAYHDFLIRQITSQGGLDKKCIDRKKKEINLGFYAVEAMFFTGKHRSARGLLESMYGYRTYELKYRISYDITNKPAEKRQKKKREVDNLMEQHIYLN